jgi:hydroxymethylbilane synthase
MTLHGMVADLDGKPMFLEEIQGDPMDAQQLGKELAVRIMRQGAREILETLYGRQFGVEDV